MLFPQCVTCVFLCRYGLNFDSYLSSLVLWIASIITMTVIPKYSNAVEEKFFKTKHNKHLSIMTGMLTRMGLCLVISLLQAALVMSVVAAFHGTPHYSLGIFFIWLWYTAICFQWVIGSIIALVGPDTFQLPATLWLILQLTSCAGLMDPVLQPGFYQIGRAFPLYYSVQGNRTILFGSYYHIEEDALVLMGWSIWSILLILVLGRIRVQKRWKSIQKSAVTEMIQDTVGFAPTHGSTRHVDRTMAGTDTGNLVKVNGNKQNNTMDATGKGANNGEGMNPSSTVSTVELR